MKYIYIYIYIYIYLYTYFVKYYIKTIHLNTNHIIIILIDYNSRNEIYKYDSL